MVIETFVDPFTGNGLLGVLGGLFRLKSAEVPAEVTNEEITSTTARSKAVPM